MQEVFNWCLNNYQIVVSGLLVVICIIISLIKKKPVNDILTYIYESAVKAILTIEKSGIVGSAEKLKAAMTIVKNCLQVRFPELDINSYTHLIVATIENILETPQKKGE